ncbi:tetraacyldisaccharide 4'-kinase [uncultured Eudoraea sp.]|uniref:tetraacyldisaccharide 4'-kinase n=1 Tax=uncultured Eudoraea sp. TaxID=1035614 RepID=UPI00261DF9A5|nr:tetraacyldisaccharide 4'-kinase [uncultured Eudoraea sp.]
MQLLRILAFPFSLIYALALYIRNVLYDSGILQSKEFKTPIVSVGNLSTGGTGKTPMIEWLLSHLSADSKLAVLSRGYKRKTRGFVLAQITSTAEEIGDEPLQIYSKFPKVSVAVDADRIRGIKLLETLKHPNLILLDDAFQHRKVRPLFSILLTSYGKLYTNDWYLPTGNLRDNKNSSKRADLIVVTKCPPELDDESQLKITRVLNPGKDQKVLFCNLEYDNDLKGEKEKISLDALLDKEVTLVTGIANPKPLIDFLRSAGITFDHREYRDHHYFSGKEIDFFNSKPLILTTEKDYMRLKDRVDNLYYISVRHRFLNKGDVVITKSLEKLGYRFL